jgi:hypothetical protein
MTSRYLARHSHGAGGLYGAIELAELAYEAHELPYEEGLSKMKDYPPQRFKWIFDETSSTDHCVKVLDTKTGRLVPCAISRADAAVPNRSMFGLAKPYGESGEWLGPARAITGR